MKCHLHALRTMYWRWDVLLPLLLSASVLLMASCAPSIARGQITRLEPAAVATTLAAPPPARVITMRYDAAGRVTTAQYGGASLHYQYDPSGNLITQTYQSSIYLPVITKSAQ